MEIDYDEFCFHRKGRIAVLRAKYIVEHIYKRTEKETTYE